MDFANSSVSELYALHRSSSMPMMMPSEFNSEGRLGPIRPIHPQYDDEIEDHNYMGMLEVEEKVEDVITVENETALFECKVVQDLNPTCTWHKDGNTLQSDNDRITISKTGPWHRLEIKYVTASDQGIYTIECRHKNRYISIKGHLFVAPRNINDGVFYHKVAYTGPAINKHLINIKVIKGEQIQLKAEFKEEANNFIWFKNTDVVLRDRRTEFNRNGTTADLTIVNAKPTDTGVYFVVAVTRQGYLSSFADVQVGDRNEIRHFYPIIEQFLPDEVEAVIGETVRLALKVYTDTNTIIKWENANNQEIPNNLTIDYGCNYIGLNLPILMKSSEGEYRVTFKNAEMQRAVSSSTKVTVTIRPENLPQINLLRPLDSAVACCGAKVTFDCMFELKDPKYFYVVWYIGHYKVERTNSHFNVICHGGRFLLYIKNLEPSMAGDVICELRRVMPHRQSGLVRRCFARLVIVPLSMLQEAKTHPVMDGKLYYERETQETSVKIESIDDGACCLADVMEDHDINLLLRIAYCRLNYEGLYFTNVTRGLITVAENTSLKVYAGDERRQYVVLEWDDSILEDSCWYSIELGQPDGTYVVAGVTSLPFCRIEYPQLDNFMVFRIKASEPLSRFYDSEVYIVPPPELELRLAVPHQSHPIEVFGEKYTKSGTVIGTGAFGTVMLVKDNVNGRFCAAKFVTAKKMRKRDNTLKEFEIMKNLRHPKIIELIGFYEDASTFIFVMEYCWGGELFDRVVGEDYLKEVDVVGYVKQICQGLEYLHYNAIVHLDLKPENIMCLSPNSRQVKLIDFGVARNVNENITRGTYGTRDYVCPEIIDYDPITTACDMWSLGVVTYMLLSGVMPFAGANWMERSVNITGARYDYNDFAFDEISDVAKGFVDNLLVRQPTGRMSATKALRHVWITQGPPHGARAKHMNTMRQNLKSYLADYRARWQLAGNVMIAAHRMLKSMKTQEDGTSSSDGSMPGLV